MLNITVNDIFRKENMIIMDDIVVKQPILDRSKLTDLEDVITGIYDTISEHGPSHVSEKAGIDLKHALNKFMPDYCCSNAILSDNDKDFFGIYINRQYSNNIFFNLDMRDIEEKHNDHYTIDIDSRLFSIEMNPKNIVALLIYDLYKILSSEATTDMMSVVDIICAGRNETFRRKYTDYLPISNLFNFCASDYLHRKYSICSKTEEDFVRMPDIIVAYGLENAFMEATEKLVKISNTIGRTLPNPALSLNWVFSVMKTYTPRSRDVLLVINDLINTSGSELIKIKLNTILKQFGEVYNHDVKKAIGEASLFSGIRKSGMRSLENDLFEYDMRVKNIDDEDSAIFLMRQINSRMSIIQDYLEEEKLSESELKRWQMLYDKYDQLRRKMTSKPIYSRKMYGLFTDYNALMQPSADNMMTMRTVY